MLAKSDVNIEFQTEQLAKALENGEDISETGAFGKARANELLNKMSRKKAWPLSWHLQLPH